MTIREHFLARFPMLPFEQQQYPRLRRGVALIPPEGESLGCGGQCRGDPVIQVAFGRMRLEETGALRCAQQIHVPQRRLQMRCGLPMSTGAGGLRRGARRIVEQRLHVLSERGVMHELRQIRIMQGQRPQNALMQRLRTSARDRAFNREAAQFVPKRKGLIVVAQQPARHRLIGGGAHVVQHRTRQPRLESAGHQRNEFGQFPRLGRALHEARQHGVPDGFRHGVHRS